MENKMSLKFDALSENESFARIAVASFVLGLDPEMEVLCDIKTAVSEAVTNAIIHGYENKGEGEVVVDCVLKEGVLSVKISDRGRGIEDISKAMEPMYTEDESNERSGMGFTVMSVFMDSIDVKSKPGCGTDVYMTKRVADV